MNCNCGVLHAKTVSLGSKIDTEKINYMGIEFKRIFSASNRKIKDGNEKSYYVGIIENNTDVEKLLTEIRLDKNTVYCRLDCCPAPPPM